MEEDYMSTLTLADICEGIQKQKEQMETELAAARAVVEAAREAKRSLYGSSIHVKAYETLYDALAAYDAVVKDAPHD